MGLWDILFRRNVKPGQIYIHDDEITNPWITTENMVEITEVKNGWVKYRWYALRALKHTQFTKKTSDFLLTRTLYTGHKHLD